jgi:hypothetical protein
MCFDLIDHSFSQPHQNKRQPMSEETVTISRDAYDALLNAAKRGLSASDLYRSFGEQVSDAEMERLATVRDHLNAMCLISQIANLLYRDALAAQREQRLFQEHAIAAHAIQDACLAKVKRFRPRREAA